MMINFEDLLNQIRRKIGEEIKKQDTTKEPLQLIYDLENTAIKLVEQIVEMKSKSEKVVTDYEKKQMSAYGAVKREK